MRVSLLSALSAGAIASLFAFSAAADSVRIGLIGEITGPNAEAGSYTLNGAKLAVDATWVGSPSIVTDTAMKLAGESLHGTYGIADFNPDANAEARIFATAYRAKYNLEPDVYSSWAYDALNVIATAMNTAKSTKPDDIRKAILGLKNWKGVEGNYTFDENGDGLRGYNIVKNEGGKVKFVEHIDVDK